MHVHNHFKHFALQPKTSAPAARKKPAAGIEYAGRVESRFGEDDSQENLGQRSGRQDRAVQPWDGTGTEGQAVSSAIGPNLGSPTVAPPTVHVVGVSVTSPLDTALASLMNAAPKAGGSAVEEHHDAAVDSTLEDLLALMRAPPPKS